MKFPSKTMLVVLAATLAGCDGRASIFPNPDPQLRKDPAQFAADAAHHSYQANAPRGGKAQAQASVDYTLRDIVLVNLSKQDWKDVQVWVNQKYEVTIPLVAKGSGDDPAKPEKLYFRLIFDDAGNHFPTSTTRVEKLEMYCDGKMYDIPLELSD